jgi:hypothetical protein
MDVISMGCRRISGEADRVDLSFCLESARRSAKTSDRTASMQNAACGARAARAWCRARRETFGDELFLLPGHLVASCGEIGQRRRHRRVGHRANRRRPGFAPSREARPAPAISMPSRASMSSCKRERRSVLIFSACSPTLCTARTPRPAADRYQQPMG